MASLQSQHYSLRWNNYINHVTSCFESLRNQNDLVDVTLCCGKKRIQAHKILLSACSNYFREIFQENKHPHPVIIFKFINYEDLFAIIEFMYKGEVSVQQDALQSFLQAAELLEVQGLTAEDNRKSKDIISEESSSVGSPSELPIMKSDSTMHKITPIATNVTEFVEETHTCGTKLPRDSSTYLTIDTKNNQNLIKKEVYISSKDMQYDQGEISINVSDFDANAGIASNSTINSCPEQDDKQLTETNETIHMQTDCDVLNTTIVSETEIKPAIDIAIKTSTTSTDLDSSSSSKWTECQFCKMVITTVNLWRHIRTQHTPQPPKKCEICSKNFKNKYSLREHIRISHEQQKFTKYKGN